MLNLTSLDTPLKNYYAFVFKEFTRHLTDLWLL